MRIDYMQYDKHGRPIGIPGHLMCDHGAIRDECEICRRDVLIAELRERLAAAEGKERTLWEKMRACRRLYCTLDKLSYPNRPDECDFDTCPLRAKEEEVE